MPKTKAPSREPQWTVPGVPTQVRDWEAAHMFLEVSRCGSFRAAAQKVGHSVNALRRTVEKLERELGVKLLSRFVGGVQLTEEGSRIAEAARRMEEASFDLLLARNSSRAQEQGVVRLSVPEGLGTVWLLPHLMQLQRGNPGVAIDLKCGQPADLLRLEADLSVQYAPPTEADLKVVKLARLHLMLWASPGYLARYGRPAGLADLRRHRFSVQYSDDRQWEAAYQRLLGDAASTAVVLRTNSGNAHIAAIAGGAVMGVLPTYPRALGLDLVPLDLPRHQQDIWLAYHPEAKRIPRIRTVMEWILKSYDSRAMPWFRDEFIHPDKFGQLYKGPPLPGSLAMSATGFP